ncbi:MAG: PQQ-binding-like beta-propeller repeat protein, partial [Planctomycetia bacterium]
MPRAQVDVDPEGSGLALLQAAERLRAAGDLRAAVELLAAPGPQSSLLVLVPVLGSGAQPDSAEDGLFVPWAEALERLVAGWAPAERAALAARRAGDRARSVALARAGDREALERLAEPPVLDEAGAEAVLALAAQAEEAGEPARAARLLARWAALVPADESEPGRALRESVARAEVRLACACGDLARLRRLAEGPAGRASSEARARLGSCALQGQVPPAALPAAPRALAPAWRRELADADAHMGEPGVTTAAVGGDARALLVHEGPRVRALDLRSGRELWAFPREGPERAVAPRPTYQPWDLPLRWVERQGDEVLAVLGDPGGSGSFEVGAREVDIDTGTSEHRARLVVLDAADGTLRWHTGALRDTHPVLGERSISCASPALVHGDALYVLFAGRRGTLGTYAACLDRATGQPRWVAPLASSECGRRVELPGEEPRGVARVQSLPWGQRPALAGDELCVVPHAGFAAGLDARTGRVRWLRALPRYGEAQAEQAHDRVQGASARNEPLAWGGMWLLAPMDAPAVVALEQGTGRLRWQSAGLPVRDLCAVAPGARGSGASSTTPPVVRLLGAEPVTLEAAGGALQAFGAQAGAPADAPAEEDLPVLPATGRGVLAGDWHVGVDLREPSVLRVQAWPGTAARDSAPIPLVVPPAGPLALRALRAGSDLAHVGGLWLAYDNATLVAYVERDEVAAAYAPGAGAARESVAACLAQDLPRLLRALDALVPSDSATAATLARDVERMLAEEWPGAEPWSRPALLARLQLLCALPAPQRERILLHGARALRAQARWPELVALLAAWIAAPPGVLEDCALEEGDAEAGIALPVGGRLRGDLLAAAVLRALRSEAAAAAALAAHEQAMGQALEAALGVPDARALREALRRAAGTQARAAAEATLLERARAAGDALGVARLCADLRLGLGTPDLAARPGLVRDAPAAAAWQRAHERLAALQSAEAEAWLEAGDLETARALLEDLQRHAPAQLDARGRTPAARIAAWRAEHGWAPTRGGDLRAPLAFWPASEEPPVQDRLGAVTVPSLRGPGVARAGERFLLLRGLELEVWSLGAGARVATLPTGDRGWLGGSLQDSAAWLPEPGVRLVRTVAGQPADRSGLLGGDWLLGWGGQPLASTAQLMQCIARSTPGRPVAVTRVRDGRPEPIEFTPQARPVEEARALLERDRVWLDAAGRAWLPTRVGVLRVTLDPPSAETLWSLDGPGTLLRLEVTGGLALACVRRQGTDDLLVALDLRTGREQWRTPLPGRIEVVEACGSALAVALGEPGQLLLLDAADGRLRWASPLEEDPTNPFRPLAAVRVPRRAWASTAGRMHVAAGRGEGVLWSVNSSTLALGRLLLPAPPQFAPGVACGAYVAVMAWPQQVLLLAPDPLGEGFERRGMLSPGSLLTEQPHHGGLLDANSRLCASGDTLYVVRYAARWPGSAERGVTVMTFGRIEDDRRGNLRFSLLDHEPPLTRATGELLLTHLEATPDGLLASGITRQPQDTGLHVRSHLWVPSAHGGAVAPPATPTPADVHRRGPGRAPPARLAGALLLP